MKSLSRFYFFRNVKKFFSRVRLKAHLGEILEIVWVTIAEVLKPCLLLRMAPVLYLPGTNFRSDTSTAIASASTLVLEV